VPLLARKRFARSSFNPSMLAKSSGPFPHWSLAVFFFLLAGFFFFFFLLLICVFFSFFPYHGVFTVRLPLRDLRAASDLPALLPTREIFSFFPVYRNISPVRLRFLQLAQDFLSNPPAAVEKSYCPLTDNGPFPSGWFRRLYRLLRRPLFFPFPG